MVTSLWRGPHSSLRLRYLKHEGIVHGLNPQVLTALIAESAPVGKDLMIWLIVNLMAGASA